MTLTFAHKSVRIFHTCLYASKMSLAGYGEEGSSTWWFLHISEISFCIQMQRNFNAISFLIDYSMHPICIHWSVCFCILSTLEEFLAITSPIWKYAKSLIFTTSYCYIWILTPKININLHQFRICPIKISSARCRFFYGYTEIWCLLKISIWKYDSYETNDLQYLFSM